MIQEGFSVFHEVLYDEFYPEPQEYSLVDIAYRYRSHKIYFDGAVRVNEFIKAHGEDILLQIPQRWKELDATTPANSPWVRKDFFC